MAYKEGVFIDEEVRVPRRASRELEQAIEKLIEVMLEESKNATLELPEKSRTPTQFIISNYTLLGSVTRALSEAIDVNMAAFIQKGRERLNREGKTS